MVWGAPLIADAPAGAHARLSFVRTACNMHPAAELLGGDDERVRVRIGRELVEGPPAEVLRRLADDA